MRIGLDLDNTIIDYGEAFHAVAVHMGLLRAEEVDQSKEAVKRELIARDPSETLWMRLQGQVYGRFIHRAKPYSQVGDFLHYARSQGWSLFVVSHKTQFGHFDDELVDLREAALAWLATQKFAAKRDAAIPFENIYFEGTRAEKLQRIQALQLDFYVDDLAEVLTDNRFPSRTIGIHFNPNGQNFGGLPSVAGWRGLIPLVEQRVCTNGG